MLFFVSLACQPDKPHPVQTVTDTHTGLSDSSPHVGDLERFQEMVVQVTRAGVPAPNALVIQPGTTRQWQTNNDGVASTLIDRSVSGSVAVSAMVADAHIGGIQFYDREDLPATTRIDLRPMPTEDHDFYTFQDPGTPTNRETTAQCAHCHVTINEQWYESVHRTSASNPKLYDFYLGTTQHNETACLENSGEWQLGQAANGQTIEQCYLGSGVQPTLNQCVGIECNELTETAYCASCHAPGIDGELVGRDLMDAVDRSYEYGTHCDVCHKVESIDLSANQPGVAGVLQVLRPDDSGGLLDLDNALMFGPNADILNPKMGSVQRDHYREATLCAGCHELHQPVLMPNISIDLERWPTGKLPIHTTYSELQDGPLSEDITCQSCHMPPAAYTKNGADLGNIIDDSDPDISTGWPRPAGQVRKHSWPGPRSSEIDMLSLAAGLFIEQSNDNGLLSVAVTTKNVGPGHAIPTGEPLRTLILRVGVFCSNEPQPTVGGHLIPDYGGYIDSKGVEDDWYYWPNATVGQKLRIIESQNVYIDYSGYGPFGNGEFSVEEKGIPETRLISEVEITAVNNGTVETTPTIPEEGSHIFLVDAAPDWTTDNQPASDLVGLAGFGFARVTSGADGRRFVPHFEAVDIVSDNRLLPQQEFTTTHQFETECDSPEVKAQLLYRSSPPHMATERGWTLLEQIMVEVSR